MKLRRLLFLSLNPIVVTGWRWFGSDHHVSFNASIPVDYKVKGINWFGGDNRNHVPEGLWSNPLKSYFEFFSENKFNSIRVPFSFETYKTFGEYPDPAVIGADPSLQGKSVRDIFHTIFNMAHDYNMTILLDFHTINGVITEYPYLSPDISSDATQDVLVSITREFSKYPNLLGIDLKNEPHGAITWEQWSGYCGQAVQRITREVPEFNGLFFIEGVQSEENHSAWGGSFSGIGSFMDDLLQDDRIVLSPHVYGVSVRGPVAITEGSSDFEAWFGFLKKYDNPIIVGEHGGMFIGDDISWHYRIRDYLISIDARDSYYWCLNPTSIDTGGILLDDWRTPNRDKIEFMNGLQPDPTFLSFPAIVP